MTRRRSWRSNPTKKSDFVSGIRVSIVREPSTVPAVDALDTPAKAATLFRGLFPLGDEREHFMAAYLDNRSRVKGVSTVSIGTLSASLVHPREVFRPAIVAGAAAVVISHNHPSGDPSPSPEDREATRRLLRAGELLGIPLLDHVIIAEADGVFFSFKERGLLSL